MTTDNENKDADLYEFPPRDYVSEARKVSTDEEEFQEFIKDWQRPTDPEALARIEWIETTYGTSIERFMWESQLEKTTRRKRDNRVCLCGHSAGAHTEFQGIVSCAPSKHSCPCANMRLVLRTDNLRKFIRITKPNSDKATFKHPLAKGIADCVKENIYFAFINPPQCDNPECKATDARIAPYHFSGGMPVRHATKQNVWLCDKCATERGW